MLPQHVAFKVAEIAGRSIEPLQVFWVQSESRVEAAAAINDQNASLLAYVLRDASFEHPDLVASDVSKVLEALQNEILARAEQWIVLGQVRIVILSHRALGLPMVVSPITLPGWMPVGPGAHSNVRVQDVSGSVDAPLSSEYFQKAVVSRSLVDLERTVCLRFKGLADERSRRQSLESHMATELKRSVTVSAFTEASLSLLGSVHDPDSFRPSVKQCDHYVTVMWAAASRRAPEELGAISKAFATALAIEDCELQSAYESIHAVLGRPSYPEQSSTRFVRGMMGVVRLACQLTTAAAHADAYPRYPVRLQQSVSRDVIEHLRASDALIANLSLPQ